MEDAMSAHVGRQQRTAPSCTGKVPAHAPPGSVADGPTGDGVGATLTYGNGQAQRGSPERQEATLWPLVDRQWFDLRRCEDARPDCKNVHVQKPLRVTASVRDGRRMLAERVAAAGLELFECALVSREWAKGAAMAASVGHIAFEGPCRIGPTDGALLRLEVVCCEVVAMRPLEAAVESMDARLPLGLAGDCSIGDIPLPIGGLLRRHVKTQHRVEPAQRPSRTKAPERHEFNSKI